MSVSISFPPYFCLAGSSGPFHPSFAFSVMVAHLFSSTFPSMFLICGLKVAVWIIMFVLLNGRLSLILWFSQSLSFINTLLVTLSPPSAHTHTLTHFHFSVPLLDLCWPLKLMKNTEKQPLHNIKSAQTSAVTVEPPHLFDVLCLEQLMLMANLKCFAPPLLLYSSLSVIFVEIALTSEMHVTHRYFDVARPQMTIQPGPVGMVCVFELSLPGQSAEVEK